MKCALPLKDFFPRFLRLLADIGSEPMLHICALISKSGSLQKGPENAIRYPIRGTAHTARVLSRQTRGTETSFPGNRMCGFSHPLKLPTRDYGNSDINTHTNTNGE
jgi:hypothetical protein